MVCMLIRLIESCTIRLWMASVQRHVVARTEWVVVPTVETRLKDQVHVSYEMVVVPANSKEQRSFVARESCVEHVYLCRAALLC